MLWNLDVTQLTEIVCKVTLGDVHDDRRPAAQSNDEHILDMVKMLLSSSQQA